MLSLITFLAGVVLVALVVVNVPTPLLLAALAAWWALGSLITRWVWEVFVGQDKGRAWKWGNAVAWGGLWPLWLLLTVLITSGESRTKGH